MRKRLGTLFAIAALLTGTLTVAGVALAANQAANLDQCANDPLPSPPTDGCNATASQWVNGNLGTSKSVYREGDSIPYRMTLTNLVTVAAQPNLIHHLIIEWDTTKSGTHAIDYLTTFNRTVGNANPCLGVSGCSPASFSFKSIPADSQVAAANVTQIAGDFRLYGGTITSLSAPLSASYPACTSANVAGGYCYSSGTGFSGDKSAAITINFTATVANPVLAWGGHIATRQDWPGASAINISGSPYHTRLIDLDGSGGNQDRSLSAAAVIFPGSITIIKDAVPNALQDFSFAENGGLTPSSFAEGENVTCTFTNTHTFNSPSVLTQVKTTGVDGNVGGGDDVNVTNGASVAIGTEVYDTASLSGGTATAGGTVDYYVEKGDSSCTIAGATSLGTGRTVTNGVAAVSDQTTFATAGTYYFWAVYGGDPNNAGNTSGCSTELVVVDKTQSSTTTAVKLTATDAAIGDGGHIAIGTSIYDTNSVTGSSPTGTVTYYFQKQTTGPADCTSGTIIGVAKSVGVASDSTSFSAAGTYELWAVYAGDDNNIGSTSLCGSETVIVDKNTPGVATTPNLLPNDQVHLTGLTSDATGYLYVELQIDAPCGTANPAYSKTWDTGVLLGHGVFTGNGYYDTDNTTVFVTEDHVIKWCTYYSGDANNAERPIASDGEVIKIDFGYVEPIIAGAFGFAIPMLLWGLWNRKRRNAAE